MAPCSVKAQGSLRRPPCPGLDVTDCDLKSAHSSRVSRKLHVVNGILIEYTCVVITFRDGKICDMRDYSDAHLYETFRARHPELPKFRGGK